MIGFLDLNHDDPSTLCSLQAKTKGCQSRVDIGVKYADKQERMFDEEKMKAGQCVIGLQVQHDLKCISPLLSCLPPTATVS